MRNKSQVKISKFTLCFVLLDISTHYEYRYNYFDKCSIF